MKWTVRYPGKVTRRRAGIAWMLFLLSLGNSSGLLFGQDPKPLFLGFQPAITRETFYEANEFDINVFPLVIQFPVSRMADFRMTTLVNYHLGTAGGISDLGFYAIIPVYLIHKKEQVNERSHGFYFGPLLGVGKNLLNDHFTLTCGMEPGYLFPAKKRFTLSLGLQLGGSYFIYDERNNILRSHFGFKVNLGFWLN